MNYIIPILIGIVFGFLLQRTQITKYETIVNVLRFKDFTVIKFMMSAIVVGMVGLYIMIEAGMVPNILRYISPVRIAAIAVGGTIFGVGFALLGGWPGQSPAALGEGRLDSFFGIIGILIGAFIYGELYNGLRVSFLKIGYFGKMTFPVLLNLLNPWYIIIPFVVFVLILFFILEKFRL